MKQPEGEDRRVMLRAVQKLASQVDIDLRIPLERAMQTLAPPESAGTGGQANSSGDGNAEHETWVRSLGAEEVARIDAQLLDACSDQWRQAARLAGTAVASWPDLPISFFAARLQALARQGKLEARGDLSLMLHSEVRRQP
ncbi:DUF3658 domain-containing protein [Hydrogenophaga sp. 5NK40-0174]|uniref:DUF3658 domain-containing protein n=1 Tax=Hydrogenophaga sp. 5NK40-0174 TaxID=3127649 RepID=UPI00333E5B41